MGESKYTGQVGNQDCRYRIVEIFFYSSIQKKVGSQGEITARSAAGEKHLSFSSVRTTKFPDCLH